MQTSIPNLDLCALSEYRENDIMISRFAQYLAEHQNLVFPHRHSFYQFVLFTKGGGTHTIDFRHFAVAPFQIYFMIPGQVHTWDFEGDMDGYVVNFSEIFFRSFLLKTDYLDSFSFWNGITEESVLTLPAEIRKSIINLSEDLVLQYQSNHVLREDMIRLILLQLFVMIEQNVIVNPDNTVHHVQNAVVRNFQKLVEKNYVTVRLPGEYAHLLSVTPNHLNALVKEHLGKQAGEVIRNRIILEAKRMLVSLEMNISEIAYELNFSDNSYFTKFFKKYEGTSPETFRKKSKV
ncbi:helix-turn-helix transcriptional regulator [Dyadobacter sp. NIV53]|uniref:AraC family transcriptional regulator n=1 Tax=Dyadobacter sp. NIV53 TaxID=2861765 RepID=UPI001C87A79C|nr:helix-turn-helix transcriptional regulator [Dyadobacter sp. NIV53]